MEQGVPPEGLGVLGKDPAPFGHRLHHLLKVPEVPVGHRLVHQAQRVELRVILAISLAVSPRLAW